MESYEERLAKRKRTYEDFLRREEILEAFLNKLSQILPIEDLTGGVNSYSTDISYTADSAEVAELTLIPKLSELFEVKWDKFVNNNVIHYSAIVNLQGERIYLSVYLSPSDTCRIISRPTGKMITVNRYVSVEIPEVEYVVDCKEEGEKE